MNIKFITIAVKDLEKSLKFYKEILNFTEVKRFSPMDGINIVFLKDKNSGLIELIENHNKPSEENDANTKVSIGLGVSDMERELNELKSKGIEPIRGPIEVPSGEKFVFIEDPDGVEIELIEGFTI